MNERINHYVHTKYTCLKKAIHINHFPYYPKSTQVKNFALIIQQSEHKRTSHFQNDTENKCGIHNFTPTPVDRKTLKLLYTPHRESICAPRVTWQMSRQKSNSSQTLCRMSLVMEAMAVVICCLNSGKDCGRGGTNTLSFR
jgi:hypothetical protein